MSNLDTTIGLDIPTMAEIIQSFVAAINLNIDPSFAIEDDNLASQIVVVLAQECSNLFDTIENAYDVLNPQTASDQNLDDAAKYVGVTRSPALATQVFLLLSTATNNTVFPANTSLTAETYTISNSNAITIKSSETAQAMVKVTTAVSGQHYTFELDNTVVDYVATGLDTPSTIATALVAHVLSDTSLFTASITAGDTSQLVINKTTIGIIDYSQSFSIVINTPINLSLTSISAYLSFLNSVTGNITIPFNTFDLSTTPVAGVSSKQPANGINGAPEDSDQTLRLKRALSLAVGGNRTIIAIQSALLATLYVQKARVYQNTSDTPFPITGDVTLLPHSIYAVLVGGYSQDIGTSIYNRMSEGIQTNGSTTVTIKDQYNNNDLISFTYAEQISIAMTVVVTIDKGLLYKINQNDIASIKAAVLQYIQTLNIAETMYIASVSSVAGAQVEYGVRSVAVSYTILPSPTVHTDNLVVDADEIIVINPDNLTIMVAAT